MQDESQTKKNAQYIAWTFFAGAMTRFGELPVGHVLERIRVWLNTNPSRNAAVKTIYQEKGFRGFYQGIFWNAAPAMFKTGLRWTNVTISDQVISRYISSEYKNLKAALIGGTSAFLTTTLFCPFERLKVVSMTKSADSDLIFSNLMRGWRPMFIKQATISTVFNVTYSFLMKTVQETDPTKTFTTVHLATLSAAAGIVCAAVTTPIDMIKDQMQMDKSLIDKRVVPATFFIYKQYGIKTMFRALPVKACRSAWYFGATTFLMDSFKALPKFMQPEQQNSLKK